LGPSNYPLDREKSHCRQEMVGHFAVEPEALAQGDDEALFRLFVSLSMFQALRAVVIMRQQRSAPARAVDVGSLRLMSGVVAESIAKWPCAQLWCRNVLDKYEPVDTLAAHF